MSPPSRPTFPALSDADRTRILAGFNDANREHFGGTLGFRCVDLRSGWARLEVENRAALMNPVGVMHGGASFGLADAAVAAALMTVYGIGTHALLTIEMKINYLEPIPAGLVAAEATVLRASRRSAYAEVDVLAGGRLAARASTTYMIKPLAAS
jgi:uncharacterized protein (TIGR00369 family)